jgi:glutamate---cysteine ligase / carboxylate-amine ligase
MVGTKIYEGDRYRLLVDELQMVARSLLIFGVHVHVGIEDLDRRIHIMNAARYFLPHVLAMTTSSPFWLGFNTGLKSYRSEVFKKFPRTDIPDHFESTSSINRYVDLLIKMNCIQDGTKIWWDVRPHCKFPTLGVPHRRHSDARGRHDRRRRSLSGDLRQAFDVLIDKNWGFRLYHRRLIQENKWRAIRYGLDGKLLDLGKQKEVPVKDLIRELLDFVDDVVSTISIRGKRSSIFTPYSSAARQPTNSSKFSKNPATISTPSSICSSSDTMENVPEVCFD